MHSAANFQKTDKNSPRTCSYRGPAISYRGIYPAIDFYRVTNPAIKIYRGICTAIKFYRGICTAIKFYRGMNHSFGASPHTIRNQEH